MAAANETLFKAMYSTLDNRSIFLLSSMNEGIKVDPMRTPNIMK